MKYSWPGNIRELKMIILRANLLSDQDSIQTNHIQFIDIPRKKLKHKSDHTISWAFHDYVRPLWVVEKESIQFALDFSGGNIKKCAEILQIARNTLYRKMERYELT